MLKGPWTISLTPFDNNGNVDYTSLRRLTDFYIDAGVHGITALGIMSEVNKLSDVERANILETIIDQTRGRIPVVAGCSAPGTDVCVNLAVQAQKAGAAAVMVAPPPQVRNEDLLLRHYSAIADHLSVPIVVQDEPVTTGVQLTSKFLAQLADAVPLAQYVKLEEAPTTIKTTQILQRTDKLKIFGGLGGMYFYEELQRGAVGIMTGFAYPEILVKIYDDYQRGDIVQARQRFYTYLPLIRFEAQLGMGGVAIRKEVFRLRNIIDSAYVRSPGIPADKMTMEELRDLISFLGLALGDSVN